MKIEELNSYDINKLADLISTFESEKAQKPYKEIRGFKVSENGGKSWRLVAICLDCKNELEPPVLVKDEGLAGVQICDWCGCRNIKDAPQAKQKEYYNPQPILTVKLDNQAEIEQFKEIFHRENLENIYENNDAETAHNLIVEKCKAAMESRNK